MGKNSPNLVTLLKNMAAWVVLYTYIGEKSFDEVKLRQGVDVVSLFSAKIGVFLKKSMF
jgi:hypothetical protein